MQLNPRHWDARVEFGLTLLDRGKIVEAFEQAQVLAGAENEPNFPHWNFGILLARA